MNPLATTKLSSKGQIVIPESIRDQLHLKSGDQFVVVAEKDVVILKIISQPSMQEFHTLIAKTRKQAKKAGITRTDLDSIIKLARNKSK